MYATQEFGEHATQDPISGDRVGLVGYHDKGFVRARPAEPYAHWLLERVQDLPNRLGGSWTNITDGLRQAVSLLQATPRGQLRRIWLLSDGYANREAHGLPEVLEIARRHWINVNTIGFGDAFDEATLKNIAAATHNGKFVSVQSLRQLTDCLIRRDVRQQVRHRAETTIYAIDLSWSMTDPMDGKQKIEVVVEAMLRLLDYKQRLFA